ncbi:MAG: ABC transporter permease subunit [Planctomycetes bacterium]|nr:ABC transporter permease subunit [Planctomycetota bacterium]
MKNSRVSFPFTLLRFWFWRILWLWLLVGFFISIIQIIQCSIAQDNENVKMTLDFLQRMPGFIKEAVGGDILDISSTTGFIAITYQHPLVLALYMVFAVCVPTGLLAGHVQDGNMELILSRSVTKNQVYICACILTLVGMLTLVIVMFLGTVVGINVCSFDQEISLWPFFRAAIVGGLLSATAAGVSLLAAATFRNRGRAVGIAMTFFIVNYFIDLIAGWWPRAKFLGPSSIFYYLDTKEILVGTGWPTGDMAVLASILIVTVIAGGIIWNRRDLPL